MAASVPLPDAVGPSTVITGMSLASALRDLEQRLEVLRKGLGDAARVEQAHRHVAADQRVERRQRQAHRHAVVVVGAQRRAAPVRSVAGGSISMKSAPSMTVAPSLRNSVAIAAMRSVSLTRQLPMWVRRVRPSAYSAIMASVIAASGMWLQSSVTAFSGHAPRRTSIQPGPPVDARAHRLRRVDEADVALDRIEPDALDAQRRLDGGDRAGGDEVRRRRRIALDVHALGAR